MSRVSENFFGTAIFAALGGLLCVLMIFGAVCESACNTIGYTMSPNLVGPYDSSSSPYGHDKIAWLCAGFRVKESGEWGYSGQHDQDACSELRDLCNEKKWVCEDWESIKRGMIGWGYENVRFFGPIDESHKPISEAALVGTPRSRRARIRNKINELNSASGEEIARIFDGISEEERTKMLRNASTEELTAIVDKQKAYARKLRANLSKAEQGRLELADKNPRYDWENYKQHRQSGISQDRRNPLIVRLEQTMFDEDASAMIRAFSAVADSIVASAQAGLADKVLRDATDLLELLKKIPAPLPNREQTIKNMEQAIAKLKRTMPP